MAWAMSSRSNGSRCRWGSVATFSAAADREHRRRAVAVLNGGRMHDCDQHQPERVGHDVALASLDLLAGVVA